MKNKAPLLFAALLAAALGLGAACPLQDWDLSNKPQGDPELLNQPFQTVRDDRYGISLSVPQTWTVTKKESNPVLFAVAPGATSYGPMANVVIEDLNQRMAPFDYLQANILSMRISLPGLKIIKGGVELYGGASQAWIQYRYPRGQIQVEAIAYCQTQDYRALVATTISPAVMFQQNELLFRAIGRSLRAEEPKPGN